MKNALGRIDPWNVVEVVGAALLGGGVWAEWGPQWACMLWGSLLLMASTVRAVAIRASRATEDRQ
jgi:hypothetical protein